MPLIQQFRAQEKEIDHLRSAWATQWDSISKSKKIITKQIKQQQQSRDHNRGILADTDDFSCCHDNIYNTSNVFKGGKLTRAHCLGACVPQGWDWMVENQNRVDPWWWESAVGRELLVTGTRKQSESRRIAPPGDPLPPGGSQFLNVPVS